MDIHGYPRKNDMDMDMDMDGIFLIHGKPGIVHIAMLYKLYLFLVNRCSGQGPGLYIYVLLNQCSVDMAKFQITYLDLQHSNG